MAIGPHPNPLIRAEYVAYGGLITEETLLSVGDALSPFHGSGWYESEVKPMIGALATLRASAPLTSFVSMPR